MFDCAGAAAAWCWPVETNERRPNGLAIRASLQREGFHMRILVAVDGSATANRAAAHAVALAEQRADAEITLLNVQNQQTLDISDVSRVTTVRANAEYATDQSQKTLSEAVKLCRDARVKFNIRSAFGPIAETISKIAAE